jgi:LysM repeat protein
MNDKFTNNVEREEDIARKLTQVAEQTRANGQFAADLEEKLRGAHQPRTGWPAVFDQVSPTLRWVALMVLLALVLSLSIKTLIPAPQPAAQNTPVNPKLPTLTPAPDNTLENTPAPEGESFDFRGAKLYMSAPMPNSPAQASVYQLLDPEPASAEYAQALAKQFGIDGDVYLTQGQLPNTQAFMVTDGKQQLVVNSETNYTYISDLVANSQSGYNGFKNDNAEGVIRDYLSSHGFDFHYVLDTSGLFGGYVLTQLAPDGIPMEYEYFSQPVMRITFNQDGSVLSVNASLMKYDSTPLGTFGIISADDALKILLDDSRPAGKIESAHGSADPNAVLPQNWYYPYPDNETVNFYGNISVNQPVDASKSAMIFIDNVPLIGNTSGMDSLENYSYVEATGQFVVENGIRKFNVESWDKNIQQAFVTGSAHREGDNVVITNEDGSGGEYILIDPPSDLPLDTKFPDSQLSANGVIVDGKFYWTSIQFIADTSNMGGGGGGGGYGFYQLNLSGTPIPFPTATPAGTTYSPKELASFLRYTVKEGDTVSAIAQTYGTTPEKIIEANNLDGGVLMVGTTLVIPGVPGTTHFDGERGTVQVQIYEKPNGTRRTQYTFLSEKDGSYYQLTGDNLEPLEKVVNRPIDIWGTISFDENGMPSMNMEKFDVPYPDLQFEVLTGTQEMKVIDGMQVVLFSTAGTTYVQVAGTGGYPDSNYYPDAGEVNVEALRVPGETYKGYPAMRTFSFAPAKNPVTGDPIEIRRNAETISVLPDPFGDGDHYVQPDIVIDHVELMYYVSNPMYQQGDNPQANAGLRYIQPAWHFQGHYSNGDALDVLIQALKQEYLSPDLSPHQGPG